MKWILSLFAAISPAFAISISTGTTNWLVDGNPAVIESVLPSNWAPNTGGGQWVGPTSSAGDPSAGAPAGTYIYTLAIGALFGGPGVFTFDYAADNDVTWSIIGGGTITGTGCTGNCFSSFLTMSGTVTATSVLIGTVINTTAGSTGLIANNAGLSSASSTTNTNPTGLFVSGTVDAVPEPSTYAMLLSGACLMALRLRRRRHH